MHRLGRLPDPSGMATFISFLLTAPNEPGSVAFKV
jgi:hypothetical protein